MKSSLKQAAIAVFTAATLFTAVPAMADGVPTVDFAAIAKWNEQAKQMIESINTLKSQLQTQLDHLNAVKNIRDLDDVLNVIERFESLPDEWAGIYKTVGNIDPTQELAKLKFDPELAVKNTIGDMKILDGFLEQLDPNPTDPAKKDNNTFYRLKQANELLKSANSEIAIQKASAMIAAEQTRLQQMQLQYDTIKAKYEAAEKANRLKWQEHYKCVRDSEDSSGKGCNK